MEEKKERPVYIPIVVTIYIIIAIVSFLPLFSMLFGFMSEPDPDKQFYGLLFIWAYWVSLFVLVSPKNIRLLVVILIITVVVFIAYLLIQDVPYPPPNIPF